MLVEDCAIGDVVRIASGVVRVCSLSSGGERWCRLVDDELRELDDIDWVPNRMPVLEVLSAQATRASAARGEEFDPLKPRER